MKPTKKAVLYVRHSSHGQEQSCNQQILALKAFARNNDYTIIDTYKDEEISGTTDKRPDFQRMIANSRSGQFQFVIIYKIDRFSRDKYDSAHYKNILKKNGVKVISAMEQIADSPEGLILESVLEGMAAHYSANLSQNVKRGLNFNADNFYCNGGHPTLGYKVVDKKYVIDETTAPAVRRIFDMYVKGAKQIEIVDYLNGLGLRQATEIHTLKQA